MKWTLSYPSFYFIVDNLHRAITSSLYSLEIFIMPSGFYVHVQLSMARMQKTSTIRLYALTSIILQRVHWFLWFINCLVVYCYAWKHSRPSRLLYMTPTVMNSTQILKSITSPGNIAIQQLLELNSSAKNSCCRSFIFQSCIFYSYFSSFIF